MKNNKVTVVDYGIGNLLSVIRAIEKCGSYVSLAESPSDITKAEKLILPGVGAFKDGMTELKNRNFIDPIKEYNDKNRPFLGICLGMQMMLDVSREFGKHQGLGLISGEVVAVPPTGIDGKVHKIPHIGWNELFYPTKKISWDGTILKGINQNSLVYFVHSFVAKPNQEQHILANCDYNGRSLTSIIYSENMYGCQFHPEKSGHVGLKILNNFCNL